jgi:hypothetical protein
MSEANTIRIESLQDTFLKKEPVEASSLGESEKVKVPAGKNYTIVWKSGVTEGKHVKISLSHQAGNWYVYVPHWKGLGEVPKAPVPVTKIPGGVEIFRTEIKALNLSQPDAVTCQSTCIGMAVGDRNIQGIRSRLKAAGDPGAYSTMGRIIRQYPVDYEFYANGSLQDAINFLKQGDFLITHGWFTGSGHVICLDGLVVDNDKGKIKFDVKDPWSEFSAPAWKYNNTSVQFYDGLYSAECIYASCVLGQSVSHSREIYQRGELNLAHKGMWIHRFRNG